MADKFSDSDEIIILEEPLAEPDEFDEFDGYEEVDELDEYSEIEQWDETDYEDGLDELYVSDADAFSTTKEDTSFFTKLTAVLGISIIAAAVVLLITLGSKSIEGLKNIESSISKPLTLMDVGKEADSIETIGGNKLTEVIEAQKLRALEAKKKEIEDSFKFDEVESRKDLINVSLQLTSMLKDLKIKVVNDNSRLIANVPFSVEVVDPSGNATTFTDENKDGIIYLEGLKGGDYSVKVLSVKGYEDKYSFADKANSINVKETLEYKKVDVSNEVKKDGDVNTQKEDPEAKKPVQPKNDEPDDDGGDDPGMDVSNNDPGQESDQAVFGIDVSKWNGDIDWSAVAASGVSYAIIRCGFRGSTEGGLIEDAKFWDNIKGATSNGIKVGVYFFSQAVNEIEAVEEASMVLGMVNGYSISYPIFLDVETSGGGRGDQISADTRTQVCKAFCETVRNSGYTAGIYSNKTWFEEKLNVGELASYKLWLAQYAKQVTYTKSRYDIWQYSDSGSVHGISTGVDLNMSYLGY